MTTKIKKLLFKNWYPLLKPIIESKYFEDLIVHLDKEYSSKKTILPDQKDVFKTFQLTDYKDLKVVILGEAPLDFYNNGLAWASTSTSLPYELEFIWEAIERDYDNGMRLNFDSSLESWAKQGVLLLNTKLTIKEDTIFTSTIWDEFIVGLLKRLSESNENVVYCLWGHRLQEYSQYINSETNYILRAINPTRKWDFSFKNIDELTFKLNGDKIKW